MRGVGDPRFQHVTRRHQRVDLGDDAALFCEGRDEMGSGSNMSLAALVPRAVIPVA